MKPLGGSQKHTPGFGISHICANVMDGVKQTIIQHYTGCESAGTDYPSITQIIPLYTVYCL